MGRMESAQLRAKRGSKPRERLLDAAYDLFGAHGVSQVGIDSILAKSGCAKASLYDNFQSKEDLAIAFLERREELWTRAWLETEIKRRASDPEGRLLAIFDAFDAWFRTTDFEGCPFIKVLLESRVSSRLHRAAATHLSRVRATKISILERIAAVGILDYPANPDWAKLIRFVIRSRSLERGGMSVSEPDDGDVCHRWILP